MAAFTANQASVTNGSKVVTINSGESIANVRQGDFLFLAGFLVEINRGYVGGSSQQYIELVKNWANSSQSNQPALVIPTTGDFRAAVDTINNANKNVNDNFLAMQNWQTKTGTVTFTNQDGTTTTVKTLKQIETEADTATTAAINAVETRAQTAYREALEAASSGKNTVKYDAQGNPNVMVWIPKFNSEDVNQAIIDRHGIDYQLGTGVYPAFIKNGVPIRGFWYAKYAASPGVNSGVRVISGALPRTNVDFDTAKALCVNKGPGWHLSANWEWMAIAYLGLAYGGQPRGDTNYGRAHDATYETATGAAVTHAPGDSANQNPSLTGTGPATWSHDGTRFGVFDLVGGVWEWQDQIKMQDGQIIHTIDNNPDLVESSWPTHECYLDSAGATSGSVILNSMIENRLGTLGDNQNSGNSNFNTWRTTQKSVTYIESELMRRIGVEPALGESLNGNLYSRNYGERFPYRGGHWRLSAGAGLGALYLDYSRTNANSSFGFRPALFEV